MVKFVNDTIQSCSYKLLIIQIDQTNSVMFCFVKLYKFNRQILIDILSYNNRTS